MADGDARAVAFVAENLVVRTKRTPRKDLDAFRFRYNSACTTGEFSRCRR